MSHWKNDLVKQEMTLIEWRGRVYAAGGTRALRMTGVAREEILEEPELPRENSSRE